MVLNLQIDDDDNQKFTDDERDKLIYTYQNQYKMYPNQFKQKIPMQVFITYDKCKHVIVYKKLRFI